MRPTAPLLHTALVVAALVGGCDLFTVTYRTPPTAAPPPAAPAPAPAPAPGPAVQPGDPPPPPAPTVADRRAAEAARRAEEAARREALKARAGEIVQLPVPELGVVITVPGDVAYAPHRTTDYGDPAFLLKGEASGFAVILASAARDRYDQDERIRRQRGVFYHGVDVIRRTGGAAWEFEFSYPVYSTTGSRMGTEMGYFGRRVVGATKINCLLSGLSAPPAVGNVARACKSLKPLPGGAVAAPAAAPRQPLLIPELGVTINVPPDTTYAPHRSTAYGAPALLLQSKSAGFAVIVTNAALDRYGLDERVRAQMSEFKYGIDVVRRKKGAGGAWEIEYSNPVYSTRGARMGTDVGYFGRVVTGGRKLNCLLSGLGSQAALDAVRDACQSLRAAK